MVRPTVQVLKTAFKSMAVGIGQSKRRLTTKMERSNQGPRTDDVPTPPQSYANLCGLVLVGAAIFNLGSVFKERQQFLQDIQTRVEEFNRKIKLQEQSKQNEDGMEA